MVPVRLPPLSRLLRLSPLLRLSHLLRPLRLSRLLRLSRPLHPQFPQAQPVQLTRLHRYSPEVPGDQGDPSTRLVQQHLLGLPDPGSLVARRVPARLAGPAGHSPLCLP